MDDPEYKSVVPFHKKYLDAGRAVTRTSKIFSFKKGETTD